MTTGEWIAAAKVLFMSDVRLFSALPVGEEVQEADDWTDLCDAQVGAIKELVAIKPEPVTVVMEPETKAREKVCIGGICEGDKVKLIGTLTTCAGSVMFRDGQVGTAMNMVENAGVVVWFECGLEGRDVVMVPWDRIEKVKP